jgi:adenosine deaminase
MRELPKIELHLHHEGAAPPAFIRGLAQEKNVDIGGVFAPDGGYSYKDFWHFLTVYETATSVLKTPEDYARLTRAVLEESAENGVIYSETFLSPDFCGGGDVAAWREYLTAIREEAERAEAELGITLRGIVTCIRHFGPDRARPIAQCAAETAGDWLVGFGMAGDELKGKPGDFLWAFDCAREAGLRITVHAGEWGGAASVRDALDALNPERIGHGVQAIEDLALVDRIAEDGIVLECCPGSNVTLGVFPSWASAPDRDAAGPRCESDGIHRRSTVFPHHDDRRIREPCPAFGWDEEVFAEIARTSLDAAFCDAATKEKIAKKLGDSAT